MKITFKYAVTAENRKSSFSITSGRGLAQDYLTSEVTSCPMMTRNPQVKGEGVRSRKGRRLIEQEARIKDKERG